MEQFIKAKVLTKTFSAWGSCYYASTPAVDYIEPFVTVFDADVRIEADGQAWTMGVDNGTLKQSPRVVLQLQQSWPIAISLSSVNLIFRKNILTHILPPVL